MDYSSILQALNNASLFDLYRLNSAIDQQLSDPKRLQLVKNQLTVGQPVTYFEHSENRLIDAVVVELKRTKALVKNHHDGRLWNIPYYFINIDAVDTDIHAAPKQKFSKSTAKVGDQVCFKDRKGNELFGEITKLNPKTAGVLVGQVKWRVAYGLLMPVIDGELGFKGNVLEVQPNTQQLIFPID